MVPLFFLKLLCHISAELGYSTIQRSLEWSSQDGARVRHTGPLNPLVGLLLNNTGVIHNMRFFSPDNRPCYEKHVDSGRVRYYRHYSGDTASGGDTFHQVLLYLFPSSAGKVTISASRDGSFHYELCKNERPLAIRFVAVLAAMALGAKIETTISKRRVRVKTSPPLDIALSKGKKEFECIVKFFSAQEQSGDYLASRMFLVQGFMFHFLSTLEEVAMFFEHVYELTKHAECFTVRGEPNTLDYTLLEEAMRMNRVFPFSAVSPPPANVSVPLYSRKDDTFIDSMRFSDCGEAALLALVCCLLYSSEEMRYAALHLREGRLREFFAKYNEIFPVTMECRRDWLRVVEDLEDPDVVYVKTQQDYNNNSTRNEIEPGFINMLMVLGNISGQKPVLERREMPADYSELQSDFERAFADAISLLGASCTDCKFLSMKVEKRQGSETWDVFGAIGLEMDVCGRKAAVELVHSAAHAETKITHYPFLLDEASAEDFFCRIQRHIESESILVSLIGRYARLSVEKDQREEVFFSHAARSVEGGAGNGVFLHGIIDTDNIKCKLLDVLLPAAMARDKRAANMVVNVVSSATLDDPDTICSYAGFILLMHELDYFVEMVELQYADVLVTPRGIKEWAIHRRHVNFICYIIDVLGEACFASEVNLLDRLMEMLVKNGRKGYIEKLAGLHERGALFVQLIGLQKAMNMRSKEYTDYFFDAMSANDITKCEHDSYYDRAVSDLDAVAEQKDTPLHHVRKIYYIFFCAWRLNNTRIIEIFGDTIEKTHERVGMDFVYDCIMRRCPNFHKMAEVYRRILEIAVRKELRVRNDFIFLIEHILDIFGNRRKCMEMGRSMIPYSTTRERLRQQLACLVSKVVSRNLVAEEVEFSKSTYKGFIEGYIKNKSKMTPDKYISEIDRIFRGELTLNE